MLKIRNINALLMNRRNYKNFGHKREPVPTVTVLWHGFLTFTFLGLCIEWKKITKLIFGDNKDEKSKIIESYTEHR